MLHQFSRNELAVGTEGLEKLKNTTVAILGVGGALAHLLLRHVHEAESAV